MFFMLIPAYPDPILFAEKPNSFYKSIFSALYTSSSPPRPGKFLVQDGNFSMDFDISAWNISFLAPRGGD